MPNYFSKRKRPRYQRPRGRAVYYLAFAIVLVMALYGSYRDQFGEIFAPLTAKQFIASPREPSGPKLPTVVKLGDNPVPQVRSSMPTVVRPGAGPEGAADGSKLPTIVKLRPNASDSITGSIRENGVQVLDGDTIRVDGKTYRIAGIDAPEKGERAKCERERDLAARASQRLRELVATDEVRIDRVSCGCAPGTEGTERCNYGRLCGVVTADGRDVGQVLISEGLAKPYDCAFGHCPPKTPWCG